MTEVFKREVVVCRNCASPINLHSFANELKLVCPSFSVHKSIAHVLLYNACSTLHQLQIVSQIVKSLCRDCGI